MASLVNDSPGKPKLDRRNAKKIDYEPSTPSPRSYSKNKEHHGPSTPSPSSRLKGADRIKSFRLEGLDSKGEIEKYSEALGLAGGIDAFSIPQEEWKAGQAKTGSMQRVPVGHKSGSVFPNAPSPLESKDQAPSHGVQSEPQFRERPQTSAIGQIVRPDARLHHDERRPSGTTMDSRPLHDVRTHYHDDSHQGDSSESTPFSARFSKSADEASSRDGLLPPPARQAKSDLHLRSTHELLDGLGTNKDMDNRNKEAIDHDHTSAHNSEVLKANATEDDAKQHFVSKVVLQHSNSAKQRVEDGEYLIPLTPEGRVNSIHVQSWKKLDSIGSGSFGTVYEALSEDGMYFAVKEVSLIENDSNAQQCVTQLEQEIEFLSKFHHENIVRYLGTQKKPDKLYIFLELVTKGSLSSLYQKHTLFDSQIRSYTRQILNGLKYLHDRKIMHRDIKCANILVDVSGKVKLADFGLAKQISQLDAAKSCKGSAYWMAPEVIHPKETYGLPADIWSLGCTVLEMTTRRPPFGDVEWLSVLWKVGHGEVPPIPEDFSDDAKDFVKKCLEADPLKRATASQLLEHPFVQYAGGSGLTPRNSFAQDSALHVIAEDKRQSGGDEDGES